MSFLEAQSLSKTYRNAEVPVPVLNNLQLTVERGEMLAIVGPSGIGKSTLLHLLGGLDRPIRDDPLGDASVSSMSNDELARFRNRNVGFFFQFHHLLPEFTAENVAMPMDWAFWERQALRKAVNLLGIGGLRIGAVIFPTNSGGEQQRVAIARALDRSAAVSRRRTRESRLRHEQARFDLMRNATPSVA
jgi:lipoprotein-releasing system ATP-binding protein